MAGAQRFAIALVAGLILFSLIPHSSADSDNGTSITIELNDEGFDEYYITGDSILISSILFNPSSTAEIQNNPSCDFIFEIFDENNALVFSSESRCRNQVQSLQIDSGETIPLMSHEWNFKNNQGQDLHTGTYRLTVKHSTLDISDSSDFTFYGNSSLPQEIELKYNLIDLESDTNNAHFLQLLLYNPNSFDLDLANTECTILIENDDKRAIYDDCLKGTTTLHPSENIYSANLVLDNSWLVSNGEISAYILGGYEKQIIDSTELREINLDSEAQDSTYNLVHLDYQLSEEGQNPSLRIQGELINQNLQQNCDLELYVVNDLGHTVVDSAVDLCAQSENSEAINNNLVDIFDWQLTDNEGCMIDSGKYTIIVEENNRFLTLDFFQEVPNNLARCLRNDIVLALDNTIADSSLYTTLDIASDQHIRIIAKCMLVIDVTVHSATEYSHDTEFCEYNTGNFITLTDDVYRLQQKITLPELESANSVSVSYKVNFEHTFTAFDELYIDSGETTVNPELIHSISGTWDKIEYNNNHCWLISAPNSAYILQPDGPQNNWLPKEGWFGEYKALEHPFDTSFCAQFGLPVITIDEIFTEENPIKEELDLESSTVTEDDSVEIAEIAVYGVASSSVLLGLLVFISNTESIRIPATSAGLWMLALVGKTHETSDGRFQRGRLIGYLTANPGCHFRALMAALNMSNGQITHHLRLLENQELIWRINDGRFVRYYPLNNSLYPGMNPDDLPVPPLSPDPKSLQGKILTLLDDEHQVGEFPTQSELAKKLEKSQQLISHHLRTLQKYGLVEKRKMGIKNRYKLTKEALFLLETDIDYNKIRD